MGAMGSPSPAGLVAGGEAEARREQAAGKGGSEETDGDVAALFSSRQKSKKKSRLFVTLNFAAYA